MNLILSIASASAPVRRVIHLATDLVRTKHDNGIDRRDDRGNNDKWPCVRPELKLFWTVESSLFVFTISLSGDMYICPASQQVELLMISAYFRVVTKDEGHHVQQCAAVGKLARKSTNSMKSMNSFLDIVYSLDKLIITSDEYA